MSESKKYLTVAELMENAVALAKSDSLFEEHSKTCILDYDMIASSNENETLKRCEFDVVGLVSYGGSEGIYGEIYLCGNWGQPKGTDRFYAYVLKTLSTDKGSYLSLGMLVNLICYYANEYVATHLNQFD